MNKRSFILIIIIVSLVLLLAACSEEKQREFESAYTQVLKLTNNDGLLKKLCELDLLYPAQAKLKAKLGASYLTNGDSKAASGYLEQAEELVKKHPGRYTDKAMLFMVYNALAVLQFENKDYQRALDYAECAEPYGIKDEQQRLKLFKARALYLAGKKDEAYALYNLGWQERLGEQMTHDDLIYYSKQALKRKDFERAIVIMNLYQERFAYDKGYGAELAKIFEAKNEALNALLAQAMDWEYMSGMVAINKQDILRSLAKLEKELHRQSESGAARTDSFSSNVLLVSALKEYFQENYRQAADLLQKLPIEESRFHFYDYLLLASQLETTKHTSMLPQFGQLKKYYKSFPSFYHHYWQGMKKNSPDYTYSAAKDVLENCILLAPYTPFAVQARLELGQLLGLTVMTSHLLLLPPELDDLLIRATKEQDFSLLMPVLELLTTPPNVYRQTAFTAMQKLVKNSLNLRVYLEEQKVSASPELQKPIRELLGT